MIEATIPATVKGYVHAGNGLICELEYSRKGGYLAPKIASAGRKPKWSDNNVDVCDVPGGEPQKKLRSRTKLTLAF